MHILNTPREAAEMMHEFLVIKKQDEMLYNLEHAFACDPTFNITAEQEVWHRAAESIGLKIEMELTDSARLKVRNIQTPG